MVGVLKKTEQRKNIKKTRREKASQRKGNEISLRIKENRNNM